MDKAHGGEAQAPEAAGSNHWPRITKADLDRGRGA